MKNFFLMAAISLSLTLPVPLTAQDAEEPATVDTAPAGAFFLDTDEAEGDLADERFAAIEWILMNNPALMQAAVNEALRNDPNVVKEIIRDTLMRNPEIVISSLQEFQRKQAQLTTQAQQQAASQQGEVLPQAYLDRVRRSDNAPVRGNPSGTVTLVEFADYNCSYCRAFSATLDTLIANNPDLRVVHREWPILSNESIDVAMIALAAQEQGRYEDLHKALMRAQGELNAERALQIAADIGLDAERLKMDAGKTIYWQHIQRSSDLATEINLQGTPGVIIADRLARGLVSEEQIQPVIDAARVK